MKIKFLLYPVLFLLLVACDPGSSSSSVAMHSKTDRCMDLYGLETDSEYWSNAANESPFLEKDIKTEAEKSVSAYSFNLEVRSIEYDLANGRYEIFVMNNANSPSAHNYHIYAKIEGCSFYLYEDGDLSEYYEKRPSVKFDPCFCDDESGVAFYRIEKKSQREEKLSSSSKIESSSSKISKSIEKHKDMCGVVDSLVLTKYDVAYEFSDTNFLGRDFVGLNEALVGEGKPYGDCENLILDGKSGLYAYSSDVFNANHFVLETKIFLTNNSSMQNIFVVEPPGFSGAGWILRLENGELKFLFRSDSQSWQEYKAGNVPLKEWTTIRIEKTEDSAGLGDNIVVIKNGDVAFSITTDSDVSGFSGRLGIGYDAANQDFHDRYFEGMIDYIRFDNLDN